MFKLDAQRVPDLPAPRPQFEMFVYSPRFEGVHLRFASVARGGLRWSDRREDFRTEILGLAKAQEVKNSVIVPSGAKGGFVCKQLPDPADREAYQGEVLACYRMFISAMLDVTDNLESGQVVPPEHVVRHDADDPYLVVAADKGTATFSDTANEIAMQPRILAGRRVRLRRLGGLRPQEDGHHGPRRLGVGQVPLPHAAAWTSDTDDFTVVGVGDMSGDVFGNGMLLSRHIKLVAAFDHRHVFLDPDPDPAASFAERQRMFELPRSSWADYDKALISAGGGVWPRSAKSIQLSPQARMALGLSDSETALAPDALISAILTAPVDLLWNGGIGTYVKASSQANADVGRQVERRRPGRRGAAAGQGRRRRRQPRPDPGGQDRVRAGWRPGVHRLHRQLRWRRHLRPRGQHQDPAGPRGAGRDPDRPMAETRCSSR